jgi:hypothetical protein
MQAVGVAGVAAAVPNPPDDATGESMIPRPFEDRPVVALSRNLLATYRLINKVTLLPFFFSRVILLTGRDGPVCFPSH